MSSFFSFPRTVGYGFDDGPNCSHNAFYDYLRDRKQAAMNTWSHNYMTAFSNEGVFGELRYSMKAIKLVKGDAEVLAGASRISPLPFPFRLRLHLRVSLSADLPLPDYAIPIKGNLPARQP
ncbi:hypothetical protein B0H14DRAFT_3422879 [Mycena olivaceomarginata]|nr:hypothetical protein B0H14DRAFT_3422879 [Mycena olivaceomarginata]